MSSLVDRSQVERLLLLAAALRSGIIDALAEMEPATAEAVAGSLNADYNACLLVLEALAELGVVSGGPEYRLTEVGRRHLCDPGPELERARIVHLANRARGWLALPDIIRKGRRQGSDRRRPVKRKADLRIFACTMAEGDPAAIEEVVNRVLSYFGLSQLDLASQTTYSMIDIGGGLGHVALRFRARGFAATVFDTPEVARLARREAALKEAGITILDGDFHKALPPGPYDIAYLGNIYHIYGPAKNRALTERVFSILRPGGVLAAVDHVWDRSPRARMFAIDMLQATEEGGVWTSDQFLAWLSDAGFKDIRIDDLNFHKNQLILGRRS